MTEHVPYLVSNGAPTRTRVSFEINYLGVENRNNVVIEKENAANLAGFNGVKDVVECVYSFADINTVPRIIATHFGIEVAA